MIFSTRIFMGFCVGGSSALLLRVDAEQAYENARAERANHCAEAEEHMDKFESIISGEVFTKPVLIKGDPEPYNLSEALTLLDKGNVTPLSRVKFRLEDVVIINNAFVEKLSQSGFENHWRAQGKGGRAADITESAETCRKWLEKLLELQREAHPSIDPAWVSQTENLSTPKDQLSCAHKWLSGLATANAARGKPFERQSQLARRLGLFLGNLDLILCQRGISSSRYNPGRSQNLEERQLMKDLADFAQDVCIEKNPGWIRTNHSFNDASTNFQELQKILKHLDVEGF